MQPGGSTTLQSFGAIAAAELVRSQFPAHCRSRTAK